MRMGVDERVRSALREAASVLWPVECAGCGAPDVPVCEACAAALRGPLVRESLDGVPLIAAAPYEGVVRSLVAACKERGGRAEARALGAGLARAVAAAPAAALVRVPSSRGGMRRRGFDPVALVVRGAGLRAVPLRRVGADGAQKQRSAAARATAAHGSLRLSARAATTLVGRPVVVVDDVITSGATARDAVRAVRAAGGRPVAIAAVARTPKRGTRLGATHMERG
ncbi:MAG: ComF family protein [Actinomycetota bacterium]